MFHRQPPRRRWRAIPPPGEEIQNMRTPRARHCCEAHAEISLRKVNPTTHRQNGSRYIGTLLPQRTFVQARSMLDAARGTHLVKSATLEESGRTTNQGTIWCPTAPTFHGVDMFPGVGPGATGANGEREARCGVLAGCTGIHSVSLHHCQHAPAHRRRGTRGSANVFWVIYAFGFWGMPLPGTVMI